MKYLLRTLALICMYLVSCNFALGQVNAANLSNDGASNQSVARATGRILILSASYVDPNIDTVGINKLTESVTQAFSAELQPRLAAISKTPINVLDKSVRYTAGEKLAINASKVDAEAAVILSIDTPQDNGAYSIHLKVQYFEMRYMLKNGVPYSVIPTNGLTRSYYLRGPQGDTTLSFGQLADQFMADLSARLEADKASTATAK